MNLIKTISSFVVAASLFFGVSATSQNDVQLPEITPVTQSDSEKIDVVAIADRLRSRTVRIRSDRAVGSGVLKARKIPVMPGNEGKHREEVGVFVWTAGHVVSDLAYYDTKANKVRFKEATVEMRLFDKNGRSVGMVPFKAKVLKYSAWMEKDLALLVVLDSEGRHLTGFGLRLLKDPLVFKNDVVNPVKPGTKLYHVGNFFGDNTMSFSDGRVSYLDRNWGGMEIDQISVVGFPGSSGGPVVIKNNVCVGLLNSGTYGYSTLNGMVPTRAMWKWAVQNNVGWAIDDSKAVPPQEILNKIEPDNVDPNSFKDLKQKMYDLDPGELFPHLGLVK